MKISTLFLLLLLPLFGTSQSQPFYLDYNWDVNPKYAQISDDTKPMVALKDKYVIEFAYADDKQLTEYNLEHQVLWLNSDDKIEAYNKIYLPYSATSELLVSKARVITKDGKIIVLDDSKILTAQNEETGKQYKYFAFEGIDKGSFIEYYYVEKKYPGYKGTAYRLQSSFDKKNVEFDLFAPSNLIFKFKSYNNLPPIAQDTLIKDKLHWQLSLDELKGLAEEVQAPYQASRGYIVYKLDQNLILKLNDISSYGSVAQNIYDYYNDAPSKKEKGLLEDLIAEALVNGEKEEESKIRGLERYVKTNVFLTDGNSQELKNIEQVMTKKVADDTGITKLYVALFNLLDIKHEIVITSNREQLKFDKDFEANNFLTDFLFYFPKSKTYLSPTEIGSRYGFPPANLTDNYGLFIKEVTIGDFKSGLGKVKYITPLDADKTTDHMVIDVSFDADDVSKNDIRLSRSLSGYYGLAIHPYLYLVQDKDREDLLEGLAKTMNENVTVTQSEIRNEDPANFGLKPLEFILDLKTDAFTEKAGKKYLFKVGELIGRQIQMYQEKERILPLEDDFKRSYFRTINITLPKGYRIANLEDLNLANTYVNDGKELLSFNSFYELNGDLLTITADEHYRLNIIDTPIFEDYRRVINSAADFNKITLVLEPTN
tara:strand:- start:1091 stop:3058 length:1968 start_codon:yes stop_codon:yes gene_type:complete